MEKTIKFVFILAQNQFFFLSISLNFNTIYQIRYKKWL